MSNMLCVDNEKRITMAQIENHPWIVHTDNWKCKEIESKIPQGKQIYIDDSILAQMELFGFTRDTVLHSIKSKSYNPASATFNLLQLRKDRAKSSNHTRRLKRVDSYGPGYVSGVVSLPTSVTTSPNDSPDSKSPRISPTFIPLPSPSTNIPHLHSQSPNRPTLTRVQSQKFAPCRPRSATANEILLRKKRKRSASDKDYSQTKTPITQLVLTPSRNKFEKSTSGLRFQTSPRTDEPKSNLQEKQEAERNTTTREPKPKPAPLRKTVSESFGNELDPDHNDEIILRNSPETQKSPTTRMKLRNSGAPGLLHHEYPNDHQNDKGTLSSRVFSMTKQIISKRAAEKAQLSPDEPRALRTPFSITSTKNPKNILAQIENYFQLVSIPYEPVDTFVLKGLHVQHKVHFEIEVCRVPNLQNLYSIRMQRVDGEWEKYKEFCKELIIHLDL